MAQQTNPVISLRKVSKRYKQRWALQDVDLQLQAGEILGFIGPNGAGKTTLIKLMAGLTRASSGEIIVLGERIDPLTPRTPDGVGLVQEQIGFIPYLSGRKNLELLAKLRNIATAQDINSTLDIVGLDPADSRPVRSYSLGMRQRLGVAQALMEQPQLLLLDEPTNGLDPIGIVDLRKLLIHLSEQGVAIFLASHLLTEVERVCHRVLLVEQGRVVRVITPGAQSVVQITVSNDTDVDLLQRWAQKHQMKVTVAGVVDDHPMVHVDTQIAVPQITRTLVEMGVNIEGINRVRTSLEEAFLSVVDREARS